VGDARRVLDAGPWTLGVFNLRVRHRPSASFDIAWNLPRLSRRSVIIPECADLIPRAKLCFGDPGLGISTGSDLPSQPAKPPGSSTRRPGA